MSIVTARVVSGVFSAPYLSKMKTKRWIPSSATYKESRETTTPVGANDVTIYPSSWYKAY